MNYSEIARKLYSRGHALCMIEPGGKFPVEKEWQNANSGRLIKHWPICKGVGVRTGADIIAADIDVYDQGVVNKIIDCFDGINYLTRIGQPPKTLVPLVCLDVHKKIISDKWIGSGGTINQIEILSSGNQFVAFAIHPGTRQPYQWSGDFLQHTPPTVSLEFIHTLFATLNREAASKGWENLSQKKSETAKARKAYRTANDNNGTRPGDVFNRAVDVSKVLINNGWTHYKGGYWTRPGKRRGVSGMIFPDGLFVNFSSSVVELEENRPYDAFGLLVNLEYSGDFSAAARMVRRQI